MIHDSRICELGEGAFWHPTRQQFFWFDILGRRLLTQEGGQPREWRFDDMVSAAGWVSEAELLVASEKALFLFNLDTGATRPLCDLEADKPENRSNDGRADRQGGFWIGTMGKDPATRAGKGAIYRFYKGELRRLFAPLSIPNAICFAPDGQTAYFTDTATQRILKVALDAEGWPKGTPEPFIDLSAQGLYPDGAVTDAMGNVWNAQWGASRVACYSPQGAFLRAISFGAPHTSCPSFGGPDLATLFCTTALEEMTPEALAAAPDAGRTFAAPSGTKGLPEPRVLLA